MTDHRDVIAAFADNEPVDAGELALALADPAARDYFLDILVLRGLVGDAVNARTGAQPLQARDSAQPRPRPRPMWLTAAAAMVIAGAGAGFLAGRQTTPDAVPGLQPPGIVSSEVATATAPAPTHVIRLENGVDWNERSGGN